jgi:hypothetical protein
MGQHSPLTFCPPAVLVHWSPEPHPVQDWPLCPHCVLDSFAYVTQVPPLLQHPAHWPPPQLHVPVEVEHESPLPQAEQAAPPAPHCEFVSFA